MVTTLWWLAERGSRRGKRVNAAATVAGVWEAFRSGESLASPLVSGEIIVRPEEYQQENQEAGRRSQESTDVLGSHDETFAFLGPRVAFLVRGVDQWVCPLVLLNVLPQRLDRLGKGPPFHLCLVPEVLDLLFDALFIHGGVGGGRSSCVRARIRLSASTSAPWAVPDVTGRLSVKCKSGHWLAISGVASKEEACGV